MKHTWRWVVGRVLRPDGSLSGGRKVCVTCDLIRDYAESAPRPGYEECFDPDCALGHLFEHHRRIDCDPKAREP